MVECSAIKVIWCKVPLRFSLNPILSLIKLVCSSIENIMFVDHNNVELSLWGFALWSHLIWSMLIPVICFHLDLSDPYVEDLWILERGVTVFTSAGFDAGSFECLIISQKAWLVDGVTLMHTTKCLVFDDCNLKLTGFNGEHIVWNGWLDGSWLWNTDVGWFHASYTANLWEAFLCLVGGSEKIPFKKNNEKKKKKRQILTCIEWSWAIY